MTTFTVGAQRYSLYELSPEDKADIKRAIGRQDDAEVLPRQIKATIPSLTLEQALELAFILCPALVRRAEAESEAEAE